MMFIPYICAFDPDEAFTRQLVRALAPHSDIIEIGIPFSDPVADGSVIQAAGQRALKSGATTERILQMAQELSTEPGMLPFIFMTYFNIIHAYGTLRFLQSAAKSGARGLIIPDLPLGEEKEFEKMAAAAGVPILSLLAPNTPPARRKALLAVEAPFTYLVSTAGITGARSAVPKEGLAFVQSVRQEAGPSKKLAVGFGVSDAAQAAAYQKAGADGVIVGSKLISTYASSIGSPEGMQAALDEIVQLAQKIRKL